MPPDDMVDLIRRVRPAVVRVSHAQGTGSGVIFKTEGENAYILTNQHVLPGSGTVTITVGDQTRYTANVLGKDDRRDLAVVQICCEQFTTLPFADTSEIMSGLPVVNIGYALGIGGEATVTIGIISAERYNGTADAWELQSDASINPGNSGGPMLSIDGEILGINTYVIKESEGIGFAVSTETIQIHLPSLISGTTLPAPTLAPTPSPLPRPTTKPTARPTATPTVPSGPTSTPRPTATPTLIPTPTARPTPTPTVTPSPTPTPLPGMEGIPLFYSTDKVMKEANTRFHSRWQAQGNLRMEATFHNPDNGGSMFYGLVFRDILTEDFFVFGIRGTYEWFLRLYDQEHELGVELASGSVYNIVNYRIDESNFLALTVVDDQVVQLTINDTHVHDSYTAPYPQSEYYDISSSSDTGHVGNFAWGKTITGTDYLYIEDFRVYAEDVVWVEGE